MLGFFVFWRWLLHSTSAHKAVGLSSACGITIRAQEKFAAQKCKTGAQAPVLHLSTSAIGDLFARLRHAGLTPKVHIPLALGTTGSG
jgi:hypothetical protein